MTPHLRARAAHAQVLSGEVVGLSVVELDGERPAGVAEPQFGRPRIGGAVSHDDTQVSSAPRVSAQSCGLATLSPRAAYSFNRSCRSRTSPRAPPNPGWARARRCDG